MVACRIQRSGSWANALPWVLRALAETQAANSSRYAAGRSGSNETHRQKRRANHVSHRRTGRAPRAGLPPPHRLHLQAVQLLAQVLLAMQGVDGAAEQSRAVAESTIAPALALNMDDVAARSMLLTAAALSVLVNESRDPEARRVRATQARRLLDDALPGTRKKLGCQARRRGGDSFFFDYH